MKRTLKLAAALALIAVLLLAVNAVAETAACNHPHAEKHEEVLYDRPEAVDNGDGTHSYTGTFGDWYYCPDCHTSWFDETTFHTVEVENERCSYRADGKCWLCRHENDCKHPNLETNTEVPFDDPYDVVDNKNGTHSYTCKFGTVYYCPDCETGWSDESTVTTKTVTNEKCSYDQDGFCWICGHENDCTHPRLRRYENDLYERVDEAVDNGNGTHSYTGVFGTYCYCPDCETGWFEEDTFVTKTVTNEQCRYGSEGYCWICGHKNDCQHPNARVSNDMYSYTNMVDNGDGTHSYTGTFADWYYCPDCRTGWYDLDTLETKAVTNEKCSYEEDGYCWKCGHKNDCQHAHTEETRQSWYEDAVSHGDGTHDATRYIQEGLYCNDCGMYLWDDSAITSEKVTGQACRFYDGYCRVCSYKNPCDHAGADIEEKTEEYVWGDTAQSVDAQQHSVTVYRVVYQTCSRCGEVLDAVDEEKTENRPHEFNAAGVCTLCGYQGAAPAAGFFQAEGGLFFMINGQVDTTANGMVNDLAHPADWYYCALGRAQTQYSGLAEYGGEWFYVENGKLNTTRAGMVTYDGGRFMIAAGRILREYNGLILEPNTQKWYYVAAGQVADYTGLVLYDGAWFYVTKGELAVNYTGPVEYDGATFQVVNGQLAAE